MKVKNNRFTDKYLQNLKAPSEQKKAVDIRERSGEGFGITLFPSGKISFIYIYHFGRRKRRMTLGSYPNMTLAEAKNKHREALAILEKEKDPAEEVKKEKFETQNASAIAGLIEEYINIWAKPRKRSWEEDQRILYKDIRSIWGKRKVIDITKRDVVLLLESITKRGAPIAANRTLACIRRMFNFAIERDIATANPCATVKAPAKENRRERFLSSDEINTLWHKLQDAPMSESTKLALKLQLTTAQRKGEIISAEWKDICLISRIWTIPAEKAKNGKSHRVTLSDLAISLINEIKQISETSRWLFPAAQTVKEDTHMTGEAVDHALRRSRNVFSTIENFSPHTLRATAATHMASMRISSEIISRILNHAKRGITEQHYNKYDYDDEKRNALEKWAFRLEEIIAKK